MTLRNTLLAVFTTCWGAIVVYVAVRDHGTVPGALWPVLGFGVGTTIAAFARPAGGRHRPPDESHDRPKSLCRD